MNALTVREVVVHPPLARIKIAKRGNVWCACVTLDLPTGPFSVSFRMSEAAIAQGLKFLQAQAALTREAAAKMSATSGADFATTVKGYVSKVRSFAFADAVKRQRTDVLSLMRALSDAKFPSQVVEAKRKLVALVGPNVPGTSIPVDYLNVRLAAVALARKVLGPGANDILSSFNVSGAVATPSPAMSFKIVSGEAQRMAKTLRQSPSIAKRSGIPVVRVYNKDAAWVEKWVSILRNYGKDPRANQIMAIVKGRAAKGIPKYVTLWNRLASLGTQIQLSAMAPIRTVSGEDGPRADGYGPGYGISGFAPGLTPFQAAIAALNRRAARALPLSR